MTEVYRVKISCGNCGIERSLEVKRGDSLGSFLLRSLIPCLNCDVPLAAGHFKVKRQGEAEEG